MDRSISRFVLGVTGTLTAFFSHQTVRAEEPIFYSGYTQLAPTAGGSYVHLFARVPPFDQESPYYERRSDLTVGQIWTGDGMSHQVQYYDFQRAFLVFDVPQYKGVVTRDEIKIPDWAVPEVTLLRTKVLGAEIQFQGVKEDDLGEDISPIEIRWSLLSASELINDTINAETAFNGLLGGPRVESEFSRLGLSNSPTSVFLSDSFTDFLNHSDGGSVVFSFVMPIFDHRATLDLKELVPDIFLNITYDGYAPFTPVPEPAAYACFGAALCALLAVRRSAKGRRFSFKKCP